MLPVQETLHQIFCWLVLSLPAVICMYCLSDLWRQSCHHPLCEQAQQGRTHEHHHEQKIPISAQRGRERERERQRETNVSEAIGKMTWIEGQAIGAGSNCAGHKIHIGPQARWFLAVQ